VATLKLGFLASHGGSNLQAIVDACKEGMLDGEARAVISNSSRAGARTRAEREGIPFYHLSSVTHAEPAALDTAILAALQKHGVEVVCLAGYMKKLGARTLAAYRGRILNIHPALLPKFGGRGMYGMRVHEAVLAAGEKESGATVHLIDGEYDHGPVLAQEVVPVCAGDTPELLQARVLAVEHRLYAATLQKIADGDIALVDFFRTGYQSE
jgi:phosphoribosylglycinamide formyltransferase 1